jgi:hypothetical protein
MRMIKTLALAAVFAAGTSTFGLAEEASPDSIVNHEPIFGTYGRVDVPGTANVPQPVTTAEPLQVPASQWIADRFNFNRQMTVEERFFFRVEAANAGDGGGGD